MNDPPHPAASPPTSPHGVEVSLRVVGKPLHKVDAAAKVTGRAVYADDMLLPRTLRRRVHSENASR